MSDVYERAFAALHPDGHKIVDVDFYRTCLTRAGLAIVEAAPAKPAEPVTDEGFEQKVDELCEAVAFASASSAITANHAKEIAARTRVLTAYTEAIKPAEPVTDEGFVKLVDGLLDASLDAVAAYTDNRDIYDIKLLEAVQVRAARTRVLSAHAPKT